MTGCETIPFRTGEISIHRDRIAHVQFAEGTRVSSQTMRELLEAYRHVRRDERVFVLLDSANVIYATRNARSLAASDDFSKLVAGLAVIVRSPLTRVIGSLFRNLNQPTYPFQMVESETQGRAWLAEIASRTVESGTSRAPIA